MTMAEGNLDNIVLALLFAADEPLSLRKLSSILEDVPTPEIKESIDRWQKKFDDEVWSILLERVAGGYQLSTRVEYAPFIARIYTGRRKLRLSKAALETIAIIAYKQPITRAEIENVRGVACGGVVSNLMERSLIRITGKAKVLGAPFLYGTTQEFLEYLGLNSLKDLPSMDELEALLEREAETEGLAAESTTPEINVDIDTVWGNRPPAEPEEETGIQMEEAQTTASPEAESPLAARIGPDVDEPYHRPLGDGGQDPIFSDAGTLGTDEESNDEEEIRRDSGVEDRED
jgi:segregation and condensation protein B